MEFIEEREKRGGDEREGKREKGGGGRGMEGEREAEREAERETER